MTRTPTWPLFVAAVPALAVGFTAGVPWLVLVAFLALCVAALRPVLVVVACVFHVAVVFAAVAIASLYASQGRKPALRR